MKTRELSVGEKKNPESETRGKKQSEALDKSWTFNLLIHLLYLFLINNAAYI